MKHHRLMKEERIWHKTKHTKLAIPQDIKLRNAQ